MIAHFATYLPGGAGIAAHRLHSALCRNNVESRFFYGFGEAADANTLPAFQNRSFFWRNVAALATGWNSRQWAPHGFVTSPRWIRKTPIQALGILPKVVNLHWIARWLDLPSFLGSLPPELPVVWSLHDFIPVTGGCHYPGDCDRFTKQCGACPQLKMPGPRDATHQFFKIKERCYAGTNLHFVGNSEWTTSEARRSGLVRCAKSLRTIPLGLDIEQLKPVDRVSARRALGLDENRFTIGFACTDFNEARKGAAELVEALNAFPPEKTGLLTFGAGKWPRNTVPIESVHLGALNVPRLQSLFYSALDVFVCPSRAETFGLTVLEAMACGTPVVAYRVGPLGEVIVDGETGLLEPEIGSVPGLVRMLRWMEEHPLERQVMGAASRRRVMAHFTDTLMACRYAELYQELTSGVQGQSKTRCL